jgi:hypothetical protein
MKRIWLAGSVVTAMFVFAGLVVLSGPSEAQVNSQKTAPLDYSAVFKTHVPHANIHFPAGKPSGKPGGGGGKPGGGGGGGGSNIFTGPNFTSIGSTVSATSTIPEAEEHIAVDPTNGSKLVAAISDFSLRGGYNTTKYSVSYNNGVSWTQAFVPLDATTSRPATSDGQTWDANSDPVVAIDRAGRVYLANLYFNATNGNGAGGFYVSVGTLGLTNLGITQASTKPVATNLSPNTTTDEDKEWIAVDNSGGSRDGTVYASWTRFTSNSDFILVSKSTDHGSTWSTPIQVSPSSQNGAVQGSQIAVGPGGEVYVVYEVFFVGNNRAQYMAKSTNGGASFSNPVAITPQFGELKFNSTYRKSSFASLAVSPSNGNVYVVYPDQPKSSTSKIEFVKSTNGGGSFSSPVALNDSTTGERLMPSVAVDDADNVSACWFDTRNGGSTSVYDIYATRTTNAGTSFSPNARVTKNGSINAASASFIGDYGGIAAGPGFAHPVWTSGGFNNGLLQTSALQY